MYRMHVWLHHACLDPLTDAVGGGVRYPVRGPAHAVVVMLSCDGTKLRPGCVCVVCRGFEVQWHWARAHQRKAGNARIPSSAQKRDRDRGNRAAAGSISAYLGLCRAAAVGVRINGAAAQGSKA